MKITDKIHLLKHNFEIPVSPDMTVPRSVYSLVVFGEKILLVDSGVIESHEYIYNYIRGQGRDPGDISSLILSHSHPDHIGSAARIKELSSCRIFAHEEEKEWIERPELQEKARPVPGFFTLVRDGVRVDEFMEEGEVLMAGKDLTLKILHTPGHSRGSISIFFKEDKVLFTGDAVPLRGDIPNYENFKALTRSLQRIREHGEHQVMLSSWTKPAFGGVEFMELISSGEKYLALIDKTVKDHYPPGEAAGMEDCSKVIQELGLPPVFANPIVHRAFLSHL